MSLPQEHARHRLVEALLDPVRLTIVAALYSVDQAEFSAVRESVQVSESVLSEQTASLASSGHLSMRTSMIGKWPRTWLRLSPVGRAAYLRHLAALREIAGD